MSEMSSPVASEGSDGTLEPALVHTRFLAANPMTYQSAVEAARNYVSKLRPGDVAWLHTKPFAVVGPGVPPNDNRQYFRLMYDLLNMLQVMEIQPGGRILEVGCGPGWVTEILLMLGYTVDGLEPSADLIRIAQDRCSSLGAQHQKIIPRQAQFHQTTLEEVQFEPERFDAVLFFDVLHHVVDERSALAKAFDFLKPGGCIGIVEGAWHPDFKALEQSLIEEMAQFGTLENPFTTQYLDLLLRKSGFVDLQRYVSLNGFFAQHQLKLPASVLAGHAIENSNNVTARKPDLGEVNFPDCTDDRFRTEVQLALRRGAIDPVDRSAMLTVELHNTGQTVLESRPSRFGHVRLVLRRGELGSADCVESMERIPLARRLMPGKSVVMHLDFTLPTNIASDGWVLDLVAEGAYWFSTRGFQACPIPSRD